MTLNQGPFPRPELPGVNGNTGLSAIPCRPAWFSRTSGCLATVDFPCCHRSPSANMPSPMPRRTRAVLPSLASCTMAAFPVLKPGRRPHRYFRGLLRLHSRRGPLDRAAADRRQPFRARHHRAQRLQLRAQQAVGAGHPHVERHAPPGRLSRPVRYGRPRAIPRGHTKKLPLRRSRSRRSHQGVRQ